MIEMEQRLGPLGPKEHSSACLWNYDDRNCDFGRLVPEVFVHPANMWEDQQIGMKKYWNRAKDRHPNEADSMRDSMRSKNSDSAHPNKKKCVLFLHRFVSQNFHVHLVGVLSHGHDFNATFSYIAIASCYVIFLGFPWFSYFNSHGLIPRNPSCPCFSIAKIISLVARLSPWFFPLRLALEDGPDVYTYSACISAFEKAGRWQETPGHLGQ